MRVAILAPLFESVPPRYYGGTERVVYHLCRGLIERNIDVTLFASGDSCMDVTTVAVIEEALRLRAEPVIDPVPYHMKMLSMIADRATEFDLIHNHHDYWMLPLSRMTRTPMLTTLHGRLDLSDVPPLFSAFPQAHFASISNAQRKPLRHLNAIRWAATVYNGLDIETSVFQEKPGKYLAFLGRISVEKRPEWAIEIAKRSGVPLKIAAKIEGRDGQAYFDQKVKPHVDGTFVQYVGEISEGEKSEFLGNALALVFPIDWPEPFGLVMIEALACGTPVLARPCGSVNEILLDGVTGFCHPDIRVLASKVKDLPTLSRKACREWVEKRFSFKRMTEEYLDVYRHLVEHTRAYSDRWDLLHSVQRPADGDPEDQLQG